VSTLKFRNILHLSYAEVAEAAKTQDTIIIPIGSCEKHGAHLPLGTDTFITQGVVERAAELADAGGTKQRIQPYPVRGPFSEMVPGTILPPPPGAGPWDPGSAAAVVHDGERPDLSPRPRAHRPLLGTPLLCLA